MNGKASVSKELHAKHTKVCVFVSFNPFLLFLVSFINFYLGFLDHLICLMFLTF